jgi:hypothetical protein
VCVCVCVCVCYTAQILEGSKVLPLVISFRFCTRALTLENFCQFDHSVAVCVPMCPAHPPVEHGQLSVTGPTVVGDKVQVTCDEGYELEYPGGLFLGLFLRRIA